VYEIPIAEKAKTQKLCKLPRYQFIYPYRLWCQSNVLYYQDIQTVLMSHKKSQ